MDDASSCVTVAGALPTPTLYEADMSREALRNATASFVEEAKERPVGERPETWKNGRQIPSAVPGDEGAEPSPHRRSLTLVIL